MIKVEDDGFCKTIAEKNVGAARSCIAAVGADFVLNLIAYNLVRLPKLIAAGARTPSR